MARAFGSAFDRSRWRDLAALGTFGLTRPEAEGGAGLRMIDAVLVYEELGRVLVPGPVVASFLAAAVVDGVLEGDVVVTLAEAVPGQPLVFEHFEGADVLLVLDGEAVVRFDARSVGARPVAHPLDPTTPLSVVDELPAATPVPDVDAASWRRAGSLLTAALLLGIADATTDLATDYAKSRHQFGRVIGSFQAVKHMLADMFTRAEVSRAAVYAAGVMFDEPDGGDDVRALAGARVMAAAAATDNSRTCIQVHGGIGFTWEADPHLYLKRALLHDTQFGSAAHAAEVVAQRLGRS